MAETKGLVNLEGFLAKFLAEEELCEFENMKVIETIGPSGKSSYKDQVKCRDKFLMKPTRAWQLSEGISTVEAMATRWPLTKHDKNTKAQMVMNALNRKLVRLAKAQRPKVEPVGPRRRPIDRTQSCIRVSQAKSNN